MDRRKRLEEIQKILMEAKAPLSGGDLAERFGISRQAIVQDIAVLRNAGVPIVASSQGYSIERNSLNERRIVPVRHEHDDIYDELMTIVEGGGRVVDVIVDHPVYGELKGNIDVSTPEEVRRFVNLLDSSGQESLLRLSHGFHLHTIEARSSETLDAIERALREKGYLSHP